MRAPSLAIDSLALHPPGSRSAFGATVPRSGLGPVHWTDPRGAPHPIVGMTNSGSVRTPVGQRVVIVLSRV